MLVNTQSTIIPMPWIRSASQACDTRRSDSRRLSSRENLPSKGSLDLRHLGLIPYKLNQEEERLQQLKKPIKDGAMSSSEAEDCIDDEAMQCWTLALWLVDEQLWTIIFDTHSRSLLFWASLRSILYRAQTWEGLVLPSPQQHAHPSMLVAARRSQQNRNNHDNLQDRLLLIEH